MKGSFSQQVAAWKANIYTVERGGEMSEKSEKTQNVRETMSRLWPGSKRKRHRKDRKGKVIFLRVTQKSR